MDLSIRKLHSLKTGMSVAQILKVYRIFPIKQAEGVYLKEDLSRSSVYLHPAFIRGPVLIKKGVFFIIFDSKAWAPDRDKKKGKRG